MSDDATAPPEPPADGAAPAPLPEGAAPAEEIEEIEEAEHHHHLLGRLGEPDPERDLELMELENDASFNNLAAFGPLAIVAVPVARVIGKGITGVKGLFKKG